MDIDSWAELEGALTVNSLLQSCLGNLLLMLQSAD
jgi:hypothetical protein